MHKKSLKFCSVLLSASMVMTGVTPATPVIAAQVETQEVQEMDLKDLEPAVTQDQMEESTENKTETAKEETEEQTEEQTVENKQEENLNTSEEIPEAEQEVTENEETIAEEEAESAEQADTRAVLGQVAVEGKNVQTITDTFTGDALDAEWINSAGSVTWSQGRLNLTNDGGTVSSIQRKIGTASFETEIHWENYDADTSGNNSVMIYRVSDGTDQNLVEIQRFSNGQLNLLVINEGKQTSYTTKTDFSATAGWFKLTYDSKTKTVQAGYKTEDGAEYLEMTGSGASMSKFGRNHIAEIRAQKWGGNKALSVDVTQFQATAVFKETTNLNLKSDNMNVVVDEETGGIFQLSDPQDSYGTNYVINPDIKPAYDIDDSRWVGDMKFTLSKNGSKSYAAVTSLSDDIREVSGDGQTVTVAYEGESGNAAGLKDMDLTETYSLSEDGKKLNWNIHMKNTSGETLEVQDLGFPLLMNSWWQTTQSGIYEQNVARHSFVGKDGSYIYWQRPNGDGSFLVMIPQDGTSLEFKDKARYGEGTFAESDPSWEGLVEYFIHSANITNSRKGAYLPSTSLTLEADAEQEYGFTFCFADSYSELHDILYEAGVADTVSLPGMTIPKDTEATLAVRAKDGITGVTGEDGKNIQITPAGEGKDGYSLYKISFGTLGTNQVTVHYGDGKESVLQYYSTEAVETLIDANTEFITTKQQAKTDKGYDGAYLQWNMATGKLITWDDYPGGGWKTWMAGGSDDAGLSSAVYVSEKNITSPDKEQIESLDYYIENFIWGYMQKHDTYEVYRWYDGKDDTPSDQGTWRSYNYIHVANTYYNMYQIATDYPGTTKLTADEYLLRGYNTLKAMFTYGMFDGKNYGNGGQGAYVFGAMGEMNLPEILEALQYENHTDEYNWLKDKITQKMNTLFAEEYPFASEMSIDTTGFETCYTLAKMFGNTEMAQKVMKASLACRGVQPLWYYYGSDNRHMGESWWNLGYETQLGAWQQQDYLYEYMDTEDSEFDEYMRGTYGAYLAGWSNINVGQISSDPENYGAASWQYQSEKGTNGYSYIPSLDGWWAWSGESALGFWGGLKTASANIVDDDIVGLYGYGCDVNYTDGSYTVVPKDGVRTRMTFYNKGKFAVELEKAQYSEAKISDSLTNLTFTVNSFLDQAYSPEFTFKKMPAGTYEVKVDGKKNAIFTSDGTEVQVSLKEVSSGEHSVEITPAGEVTNKTSVIKVTAPEKIFYEFGEELNLDGLKVEAVLEDGTTQKLTESDYTVSGYNKSVTGLQRIKVSYTTGDQEYEDTFTVFVKNPVDTAGLDQIIAMAQSMKTQQEATSCYTQKSWEKVETALHAALAAKEKTGVSQSEIDDCMVALLEACADAETVDVVQKYGLKAAIDGTEAILADEEEISQYKASSVETVKAALEQAKTAYDAADASAEQVKKATLDLMDAVTTMLKKDARLDKLMDMAKKLLEESDQYTDESVKNLQDALEAAKKAQDDAGTTDEQLKKAYDALAEAISNLTRKGDKTELKTAMEKAEEILKQEKMYVSSTTEGLADVLKEAQKVYDKAGAGQEEINAVLKKLVDEILQVRLLGDVNLDGSVTAQDASEILKEQAELKTLDEVQREAGDVNFDDKCNSSDAAKILQYCAEKIETF